MPHVVSPQVFDRVDSASTDVSQEGSQSTTLAFTPTLETRGVQQVLGLSQAAMFPVSSRAERAHPYRKTPLLQPEAAHLPGNLASTAPKRAVRRVLKAHARRMLVCCDTCHHRRVHEVSPGTIKWHRGEEVTAQVAALGENGLHCGVCYRV